jgi:predicted  nucleic acid-binding Zn-ribbon protein
MLKMRSGVLASATLLALAAGCQSGYYAVWEKLGKEKRHLLKDQVEQARDDQEKASEEFKDALTRLKELYGFEGGELEVFYEKLKDDYEACRERARVVENRIERVDRTASDLFAEWEEEIGRINRADLKAKSRASLQETRSRYVRLYTSMTQAHAKMTPVLAQLQDYVLYLKHNLNAQAVGALRREAGDIEAEVERLIADISRSIAAADDFLKNFE